MSRQRLSAFSLIFSLAVLSACASSPPYTPTLVQPTAIDTETQAPKVDAFVVVLDVSSSMNEEYADRPKFHTAKDVVANFNETIPALDFQAGLVAFGNGTGSCLGQGGAKAVYGLSPYANEDFATHLGSLVCAGGTTPMDQGIDAAAQMLSGESGPVAVILVSDFWAVNSGPIESAVSRLKAQHGSNLCLHTVKVGEYGKADSMIAQISNVAGCDSSVNAGDIASADAMASYVTGVLLAPLQYEKHSVSATALFDFDMAVLKQQGKAELQKLGEHIKGAGVKVLDIDVVGHTDSVGAEDYNQGLSERRAMAVKEYLVDAGIDSSIVDVSGKGESEPVASNDTPDGQALNRRVEIHVGTAQAAN